MSQQSWRVTVLEQNLSGTVLPQVGNDNATVIRASKGPLIPVYIDKGGEKRILNLFGKPSSTYPDVWDVIEANKKAGIWVSAPSKNGLYSGVLVTKTGTVALTSGQSTTSIDFDAIPIEETVGTGDGSTATFVKTLTDKSFYVNQTLDIEVAGTSINVTASDAATELLTTSPDVGTGTYVRATGVLTFTFTSIPTNGQAITVTYDTDRSADVYMALFSRAPQDDDLSVQITEASAVFTIDAYKINDDNEYEELPLSPYDVSLTPNTKDGFGANIYVDDVFEDDDFIIPVVNTDLTFTTFVDDVAKVDFAGGDRGDTITITELTLGWAYFQQTTTYAADIFFDCTADSGIPAIFETLRGTYQKYSAYLLPLPNQAYATAIVTKSGYSVSNRGIYFYYNWGKARDIYNNSYLWSPLMGRIAGKHADMVDVYNGLAPSWIDENNHGGQLGSGIVEMAYDLSEAALEALDTSQINPIVFDNQYGVMIVSDRTSLTTLSDYSYIGHSRVADYCISNILNQALPFQLTKLNDTKHRVQVKSKCELIVNPLLNPFYGLLSEALVVCDSTNNTATELARREFVVEVYVKFTPFSETIKFIFTNVDQTTTVSEVAGV